MPKPLLATRRFAPLFWCQFFAAFDDNFFKTALALFLLAKIGGENGASLATLATAALMAPYFILSSIAGEIADKYDRAAVAQRLKLIEIGAAALAGIGFFTASPPLLFLALTSFGALGALFGPVKYGMLPDLLTMDELASGNALIEGATFVAILLGTIGGGLAAGEPAIVAAGMVGFAAASYLSARFMPMCPGAAPDLALDFNLPRATFLLLADLRSQTRLWRLGLVTTVFWLIGAVVMALLPTLVTQTLHGSQQVATIHFAAFAIAVSLGCGVSAVLARGKIVLLPSALGAAAAALACADAALTLSGAGSTAPGEALQPAAYFAQLGAWRAFCDLVALAICGGLIVVPAFAALQAAAPLGKRARVVAAVNVVNAGAMVSGGVIVASLQSFGVPMWALILGVGVVSALSAVWMFSAVVDSPLQDALSIYFRVAHRLDAQGLENLEEAGAKRAVVVNRSGRVARGLAFALLPKPPLLVAAQGEALPFWTHFAKVVRIDADRPMAARALIRAIKAGDAPLLTLPDGPAAGAAERKLFEAAAFVIARSGAEIAGLHVSGPSPQGGPRRLLPKYRAQAVESMRLEVELRLKGRARRRAAGERLRDLVCDMRFRGADLDRSLFDALVEAARRHGGSRLAFETQGGERLTYRRMLTEARALATRLREVAAPGEAVGLLESDAPAFLALLSAGCVPVLIDPAASAAQILRALRSAEFRRVLVSKTRALSLADGDIECISPDELRASVTGMQKLQAVLRCDRPLAARRGADLAAILFSSGAEGPSKAIALSHKNILANAAQLAARCDVGRNDIVLDALPLHHGFSLVAGFLLPLLQGAQVRFDAQKTPQHIHAGGATILLATETILASLAQTAGPCDFAGMRYALAVAEPVKAATRALWMEKFGVSILEGYGLAEATAALAVNTTMHNRFGSVGRLLPGVETYLEPIEGLAGGARLFVRGANVMLGSLDAERPGELTALREGWLDTGDIAAIDADGFLWIKGRAARFARIGAEMVSLAEIEAMAMRLWPQAMSVAAIEPDTRKGERVVLLTTQKGASRARLQSFFASEGAIERLAPADVIVVESLPRLASGKPDYAATTFLLRDKTRLTPAHPRAPNGLLGRIDGDRARGG